MEKTLVLCIIALIFTSCATTHPGFRGESINGEQLTDISISAQRVSKLSDKHHDFIDFTFENKGSQWIRISNIDFSCGQDCDKKINIYVGEDLVSWAKGLERRQRIRDFNTQVLLSSLFIGGTVASGTSSNQTVQNVGGGLALGSLLYSAGREIGEGVHKTQTSKQVPDNHIYGERNVNIPAGMFDRRWILIQSPIDFEIDTIYLTVERVDGKKDEVRLSIIPPSLSAHNTRNR